MVGISAGAILGIIGFFTFLIYGGNNGCWAWIDELYNSRGYESCGPFGASAGVLFGVVLGIVTFSKQKLKNPLKFASLLLLGTFVIPFLVGIVTFFPSLDEGMLFIIPLFILSFMGASAILSGIIVGVRSRLNK